MPIESDSSKSYKKETMKTSSNDSSNSNESEQNEQFNGYNSDYNGSIFGLLINLPQKEYLKGIKGENFIEDDTQCDNYHEYAVTLDKEEYLNPAGCGLTLSEPNIESNINQQFSFGRDNWNTVIDSMAKKGMVFDVANAEELNPREGTAFYLFPFHGRHNQHFVFRNGMIYAMQNGHVVTYVGGDVPFVLMKPKESLRERQTFHIQLC